MTFEQQYYSADMWLAHDGYSYKPYVAPKPTKSIQ